MSAVIESDAMQGEDLLPPNASAFERSLSLLGVKACDLPVPLAQLWQPELCPESFLEVLAHAMGLHGEVFWSLAESNDAKRALVAGSVLLHRQKGTLGVIFRLLEALGLHSQAAPSQVIEHIGRLNYGGVRHFDGLMVYGDAAAWPLFRVILSVPLTNPQAAILRAGIESLSPVHCRLVSLEYQAVANSYSGQIQYNNQFNYGAA